MAETETPIPQGTEDDELSARRAAQEAREAGAEFDPDNPGAVGSNGNGQSLEERQAAGDPAVDEDDDGQMFVVEEGQRVTLSTLYKRGTPVEYEFKMTGKSVKGQGGLISLDETNVMLVVRCVPGKVEIDPTRNADGKVEKVKIRANLKPAAVYQAETDAALVALRGE